MPYSGYFNDVDRAVEAAIEISAKAKGTYVTLNPVELTLLQRSSNKLQVARRGMSSGDSDILRRNWLFIDFDVVRPKGVSATDVELTTAYERSQEVWSYLNDEGWPKPVLCMSGNGYHLLYKVDLPAVDDKLIERVLQRLSVLFPENANGVKIDTVNGNASRITKLYGTLARKGENTSERPHRYSQILEIPDEVVVVEKDRLTRLANASSSKEQGVTKSFEASGNYSDFDLEQWVTKYIPHARGTLTKSKFRCLWEIPVCPFDSGHNRSEAWVGKLNSGALAAGCHHDSCKWWDWHNLREKYQGPKANVFSGASISAVSRIISVEEFGVPKEIPKSVGQVPILDESIPPPIFSEWGRDIAERMGVPLEYPVIPMIIGLSSMIGCHYEIQPRKYDTGWLETANLYGAIVGESGTLKTPAAEQALQFIKAADERSMEAFNAQSEMYEVETLIRSQRRKELLRKTKSKEDECVKAELLALAEEEREKTSACFTRIVNDCTPESLHMHIAVNPNLLLYRDELGALFDSMSKESRTQEREFLLIGWSGKSPYKVNRIGRGVVYAKRLCLSVFGGIQPRPLFRLLNKERDTGDGLIARFSVLVWPDYTYRESIDRQPDFEARARVQTVFDKVEAFRLNEKPNLLRYSTGAQSVFDTWLKEHNVKIAKPGLGSDFKSHLSKYRKLVPSLSIIYQVIEGLEGEECRVSEKSLVGAITLAAYLEAHASRIYSHGSQGGFEMAKELLELLLDPVLRKKWCDDQGLLERRKINQGTKRWNGDELKKAFDVLVEYGWLKVVSRGKAVRYQIHPQIGGNDE